MLEQADLLLVPDARLRLLLPLLPLTVGLARHMGSLLGFQFLILESAEFPQ